MLIVVALVAASFGGFTYAYLARTGAGNPLFAQARASDPLLPAYGRYVQSLTTGALTSDKYGASFVGVLGQAALASLVLLLAALLVAVPLGFALGLAGVRKEPPGVRGWLLALTSLGLATPSFFAGSLAVAAMLLLSIYGPWDKVLLPVQGFGIDAHLILPALVLSVRPTAQIAQFVATLTVGELTKPYVTAARGKGLTWQQATRHHALRNVYAPLVQVVARTLRMTVGELILVEWLFGWPGLGMMLAATLIPDRMSSARVASGFLDPPVVATILTLLALFFVLMDTVAAATARSLDPRQKNH
jgi:peptide/nickel transport system permease protein